MVSENGDPLNSKGNVFAWPTTKRFPRDTTRWDRGTWSEETKGGSRRGRKKIGEGQILQGFLLPGVIVL